MVTLVLKNATQDGDGGGPLQNGKSDLESTNKQTFLLLLVCFVGPDRDVRMVMTMVEIASIECQKKYN